jgi:MFS family permease
MMVSVMDPARRDNSWILYPLTVCTMLPVTGVVPILKRLVHDYYEAAALETALFMSVNMAGALVTAPLWGWLSDRFGWTKLILIAAALVDALLWGLFSLRPPFWALMALRVVEGAAHIAVLSMLMAMMGQASAGQGRRARMAGLGGAIIFGVAVGAPLGGVLGARDVLLPLQVGAWLMVAVAAVAAVVLPRRVADPQPQALPRWPRLHAPPGLRLPYLFAFVDRLTVGVFVIAFTLYAGELGWGPSRTGLAIGAFMMTFTALSYPAGKLAERSGMWRLVFVGSAGYGLAFAAVPWLDSPGLWVVMVLCGFFSALMFGPNLMLVVRGSTEAVRASAVAGFNAAGSFGFFLGPIVAGGLLQLGHLALTDSGTYRLVFGLTGVLEVVCVAWALARARVVATS